MRSNAIGFTLIELIAGITAMAFAFVLLSTLVFPLATQSVDPVHQLRAAEVGKSFMGEIMSKAYDQASDFSGGVERCGETPVGQTKIDCEGITGPYEDDDNIHHDQFDDVGDYGGLEIKDLSTEFGNLYQGFSLSVDVKCQVMSQAPDNPELPPCEVAKRVQVVVNTPTGDSIPFTAYRYNW